MGVAAEASGGGALLPLRPTWWQTFGAVIAGSILAGVGGLLALLALGLPRLLPTNSSDARGSGWPWHIDGVWAAAADLGPMLAVAFGFAAGTGMYLYFRTGVRPRRWPLALAAATVGWLPFFGNRHGLLAFSGFAALVAVVIVARRSSLSERRRTRWSWPVIALLAVVVLALAAVSISYGALHPFVVHNDDPRAVTLSHGRSPTIQVDLENRGPLAARVDRISLVGAAPLRIAAVRIQNGLREAPTFAGLLRPFGGTTLRSGEHAHLFVTLTAIACTRPGTRLSLLVRALDVRLRTAGTQRTQRLPMVPALRVRCRAARV